MYAPGVQQFIQPHLMQGQGVRPTGSKIIRTTVLLFFFTERMNKLFMKSINENIREDTDQAHKERKHTRDISCHNFRNCKIKMKKNWVLYCT